MKNRIIDASAQWSLRCHLPVGGWIFAAIIYVVGASAQSQNSITIQGATLNPGDVINFTGGPATFGVRKYGHTGLYLGIDPATRQPAFLDFTADFTKNRNNQAFKGKILGLEEFLRFNSAHPSFDVFRLKDRTTLDEKKLMREAKVIAATKTYCASGKVCSSAAAAALSAATGLSIGVFSPDGYANSDQFRRYAPAGQGSVDVALALTEARSASRENLLIGRWSGGLVQSDGHSFDATFAFNSVTSGTSSYAGGSCGGSLVGSSAAHGIYMFHDSITYGRATADKGGCIDGSVTVQFSGSDRLSISWSGSYSGRIKTSSGELSRARND